MAGRVHGAEFYGSSPLQPQFTSLKELFEKKKMQADSQASSFSNAIRSCLRILSPVLAYSFIMDRIRPTGCMSAGRRQL